MLLKDRMETLKSLVKNLPELPGVYVFRGKHDRILYVGASNSLKKRLSSYMKTSGLDRKTAQLMNQVETFDYTICGSVDEAFIKERDLIGIHRPPFNVQLKDDKSYPYLKVTTEDKFPRFLITRYIEDDGARYFGRKIRVKPIRRSLGIIRKIFPVASEECPRVWNKNHRPCVDYDTGYCSGPCAGKISVTEYRKIVDKLLFFLGGKKDNLLAVFYEEMNEASENLEFEKAAEIRDKIEAIERTIERCIGLPVERELDVVSIAVEGGDIFFLVSNITKGENFRVIQHIFENILDHEPKAILMSFLKDFYLSSSFVPPRIVIPEVPEDIDLLTNWLSRKRGSDIILGTPMDDNEVSLLQSSTRRATRLLEAHQRKRKEAKKFIQEGLRTLKQVLKLKQIPRRIEGFDVSHLGGTLSVGSRVTFVNGKPDKSEYRRYRIRSVVGVNDPAMMAEVVQRRFTGKDKKKLVNLLVIDGGKGQLKAVSEVLQPLGKTNIPVLGLTKGETDQEDKVYLLGRGFPLESLRSPSKGLFLLQQIRDEAHRFALSYQHILREKIHSTSSIDSIPGIGKKRKEQLLRHFGSVNKLRKASVEEISSVDGINRKNAEKVYLHLQSRQF